MADRVTQTDIPMQGQIDRLREQVKALSTELADVRGALEVVQGLAQQQPDAFLVAANHHLAVYRETLQQHGPQYRDMCGLLRNLQGREDGPLRVILDLWLSE